MPILGEVSPSRRVENVHHESQHVFLSVVCDSYVATRAPQTSLQGCGVFRCGCSEFVAPRSASSQRCVGCHHGAMYHNKPTKGKLVSSNSNQHVLTPVGSDGATWRSPSTQFVDPEAPIINRFTAMGKVPPPLPTPTEESASGLSASLLLRREAMDAIRDAEQTEKVIRMKLAKAAHRSELGAGTSRDGLQQAFSLALHTLETLGNLRSRIHETEAQLRADVLTVMRRYMLLCEVIQSKVVGEVPREVCGEEYPPKVPSATPAERCAEQGEAAAQCNVTGEALLCRRCGERIAWRASFCSSCGTRLELLDEASRKHL